MLSTPKSKGELFLASSLRDGLEDNDLRQVKTLLVSKDADPNVLIPTHGISPFHLVIGNESETFAEEVTKLFLRHGGDPNVRSADGMTPVHVAAAWGRVAVLELLLANGGDPLRLDDDGRSPFHYAFDGSYYNAIAVLGKYCGMNADEEEDDEPKYKLTLEKILINKGDCVAEYVSSEMSYSNSTKTESLESLKKEPNSSISTPNSMDTPNESTSNLNMDNVTLRRYKKLQKDNNNADASTTVKFDERSVDEERILIGQIINRLSNTYVMESSFANDDSSSHNDNHSDSDKIDRTQTTIKKSSRRSLLPPPKYHSRNLRVVEPNSRRLKIADNSIISKSPNFRIYENSKTPIRTKLHFSSPKSRTCTSKYRENVTGTPSRESGLAKVGTRSASSTPKKKQFSSRIFGSVKLTKIEKSRVHEREKNRREERRIFDKTWRKDQSGRARYSSDDESIVDNVDRKIFTKNIAINLDDRMYDDNLEPETYEIFPKSQIHEKTPSNNFPRRLKSPQIYNNFKTQSKAKNTKISNVDKTKFDHPKNFLFSDKTNKEFSEVKIKSTNVGKTEDSKFQVERKNNGNNCDDDVKKWEYILESPGSKNAISVTSLEYDNSLKRKIENRSTNLDDEDTKIWLEIDEAWKNRCGTPPASVSFFEADDSPDETRRTSDNFAGTTFHSDYGSEDTSSAEFYESATLHQDMSRNTRVMTPRSCFESFVSVDEEYAYEDAEEGVAFIERRLCVIPSSVDDDKEAAECGGSWVDRFENLSLITSDNSTLASPPGTLIKSLLDKKNLRERLTELGENPGPITNTTFNVYLKRLWKLQSKQNNAKKNVQSTKTPMKNYSKDNGREITTNRTIPDDLLTTDWTTKLQIYRNLEEQAFKEYAIANPNRKYRGGVSKSSFCYLLLDPRVTRDLPRSGFNLSVEDRWLRFLNGIFYVGKGKAARPAAHLYDAFGVWSGRKKLDNPSEKIEKILDIWRDGCGVVCLHVFSHTMVEEACSREAAMIGALGTSRLTNCLRGTYYGYTTTMNNKEKRMLGKYLLYKAMEIFMHDGERQLFPRNVLL